MYCTHKNIDNFLVEITLKFMKIAICNKAHKFEINCSNNKGVTDSNFPVLSAFVQNNQHFNENNSNIQQQQQQQVKAKQIQIP